MKLPARVASLLGWFGGSLLLWGAIMVGFAAQLALATDVEWTQALLSTAREWAPWAILTPCVAGLAIQFPFERRRWPISLAVHVLGCAAAFGAAGSLSHYWSGRADLPPLPPHRGEGFQGRRGFGPPPEGPEGRPPGPPGERGGPRPTPWGLRARLNVPVYWIVVSVTTAVLHSRRARERERGSLELEARLVRARLDALRTQLQPHFLFNALNAISALVHTNPDAADEMIANLSDFLRLTLELGDAQQIPLRRELDLVDRYLAVEQVRFADRLTVERAVDPLTLDREVPPLVLQPLVENALRHGLQPRRGPGRLMVGARIESDGLVLFVEDDGVGLDPGRVREGIGLANTRSRLETLYGVGAVLELLPRAGGGTRAVVRIPAVRKQERGE